MVNTRPLPPNDKSYGPLPANDATNDDLLKRYGCTKPTLFKRRDPLVDRGWITPTKIATRLYYDMSDVMLLDQCSFWASKGYTIPEIMVHLTNEYKRSSGVDGEANAFVQPLDFETPDDAIEVEAKRTTTELVVRGLQTSASDLQVLGDEFVNKLVKGVAEAVKQSLPKDHLAPLDFLAKAADRGYMLTGKILGDGIQMKPSTISNWDDEVVKHGFRIYRVGKGQWRVERLPS